MKRDLIILSAEVVSPELQRFFGVLPSAMVPFQGRTALDYIYFENRNHYTSIHIIVCKEADVISTHIRNKQYPIHIHQLPAIGSLEDTVAFALEKVAPRTEATLIFGDTYVPYMCSYFKGNNTLLFAHVADSERWTVIDNGADTLSFLDKTTLPSQSSYPIVVGVFHLKAPKKLLEVINNIKHAHTTSGNNFYKALDIYFNTEGYHLAETEGWIDFGHSDLYFANKFNVEARAFNQIEINPETKSLTKRSSHGKKLRQEIEWFIHMPTALLDYIPQIYDYSLEEGKVFVEMQYVNRLTLHELYLYSNHEIGTWKNILSALRSVQEKFALYTKHSEYSQQARKAMYLTKTQERLEEYRISDKIDFSGAISINGEVYPSIDACIQHLPEMIEENGLLDACEFQIIHGDFFFANILFDIIENKVTLVDPRGEFGEPGIYGDVLYEWAKLAHSIDGQYDFIVHDEFDLFITGNQIDYRIHNQPIHQEIKSFFYAEIIPPSQLTQIQLIQSLLFLSMLPLHFDNEKRQYAMLCRAMQLLKPFMQKYL